MTNKKTKKKFKKYFIINGVTQEKTIKLKKYVKSKQNSKVHAKLLTNNKFYSKFKKSSRINVISTKNSKIYVELKK